MSEWSLSASMMSDPRKTGMARVVALRDDASCSEVLRVYAGIVAIHLFKIDVPLSSKRVGFGAKFFGVETND